MNKKLASSIKYVFFFGIGVFLVWLSIHNIQKDPKKWSEFKDALAGARYWLILPVFLILSSSHLLRALRWQILMEPMGYKPRLANTFFAVMIGYLANLAVPRLGEVLKCTILAKYEKVPAEKIVGTIVAERAFDVLSLGTVFLLALIFQFDVVMASFKHVQEMIAGQPQEAPNPIKKYLFWAFAIAALLTFIWLYSTKKIQAFAKKIKSLFLGVWEGINTARKLQHKKQFFLYSFAIWALYLLGTWIGFYATVGTGGLSISVAISALAFASIGMIVTPGGIGAYAYLLAKVLELQNPSVNYSLGYANGTLQWFAQCAIVILVGFICMGLLPWYNKKTSLVSNANN